MNRQILQGDALEKLKEIEKDTIDVIITSFPYWGLRDYGVEGQLGLEPDYRDYLKKLSEIMTELKRVLKKTGTCWINLGDTYASKPVGKFNGGGKEFAGRNMDHVFGSGKVDKTGQGVMEKSRMGIPERFYIECINDGWLARNFIPWYKANSMPSSVKDRFTNKWEPVFFFAKTGRYYFNLDEVREKTVTESKPPKRKHSDVEHAQGKLFDDTPEKDDSENQKSKYGTIDNESKHRQGMNKERGKNLIEKRNLPSQKEFVDKLRKKFTVDGLVSLGLKRTTVEHWFRYDDSGFSYPSVEEWKKVKTKLFPELLDVYYVSDDVIPSNRKYVKNVNPHGNAHSIAKSHSGIYDMDTGELLNHPLGRNPGDFLSDIEYTEDDIENGKWRKHYDDNGNCLGCGKHWTKHTVSNRAKGSMHEASKRTEDIVWCNPKGRNPGDVFFINPKPFLEAHFATFPVELPKRILRCACPPGGIVLDPFFGSGTTGVAAEQLGLQWVGIELSKEYIKIAERRLDKYRNNNIDGFV